LFFSANTVVFLEHSVRTTGTVIALEEHPDDEGAVSYSPTIRFIANGSAHTVHSKVSSNPPGFDVGEPVSVRYRKGNPADARVVSVGQTWGFEVGFGIASIVTCLVGLFFHWRVIKRKTRKPKLTRIRSLEEI
jgi:hypothetical protein